MPERSKEEFVFHIHHIGQTESSPFAIIPSYDHIGKQLSPYLHQGKPQKELHGAEFDAQKKLFWKRYIAEYDQAGRFSDIPFFNSESPRKRSVKYNSGL